MKLEPENTILDSELAQRDVKRTHRSMKPLDPKFPLYH